jgi:hypothetical protein
MKISRTLLAAAAAGVVITQIAQSQRYRQRRLALYASDMHQRLLSDIAANPELRRLWAPPGGPLSDEEYLALLHCNRQISFLSAKFRAGLLDKKALRAQARWLMEREIGRTYWKQFGPFREKEAVDRTDRVFNAILADEWAVVANADQAV